MKDTFDASDPSLLLECVYYAALIHLNVLVGEMIILLMWMAIIRYSANVNILSNHNSCLFANLCDGVNFSDFLIDCRLNIILSIIFLFKVVSFRFAFIMGLLMLLVQISCIYCILGIYLRFHGRAVKMDANWNFINIDIMLRS